MDRLEFLSSAKTRGEIRRSESRSPEPKRSNHESSRKVPPDRREEYPEVAHRKHPTRFERRRGVPSPPEQPSAASGTSNTKSWKRKRPSLSPVTSAHCTFPPGLLLSSNSRSTESGRSASDSIVCVFSPFSPHWSKFPRHHLLRGPHLGQQFGIDRDFLLNLRADLREFNRQQARPAGVLERD